MQQPKIPNLLKDSRKRLKTDPSLTPDSDLFWSSNVKVLQDALSRIEVTDTDTKQMPDAAFCLWCDMVEWIRETDHTVYFAGNGASATMASHFAADLDKNGCVDTRVFTDQALMTAIANDISYDQVYAHPIRSKMVPGDLLVAISSSGNSPNIVNACDAARERGGTVVTLTGMGTDNAARRLGHLNFWVPADDYGTVETCHAAILHHWMDKISLRCERRVE